MRDRNGDAKLSDTSAPIARRPLSITDKGAARKIEILESAKDILVEEGFHGLSFRNIAARTGIKPGNITYYFLNKEALMDDLAEYIFERWTVGFSKRIPNTLESELEKFEYAIQYMIDENKRPRTNALLQEMWAMASRSDVVMRMLDTFYCKMRAWIADMLEMVNPTLSKRTRNLRAALITAQIEGLVVLVGPRRIPHDALRGIEESAVNAMRSLAMSPEAD